MDQTTQAVVDDQGTESMTAESDVNAQEPSIDDILSEIDKEFESGTKTPERKVASSGGDDIAELKNTVDFLITRESTTDINKAVEKISGEIDVKIPQKAIKGMLFDMANEDKRISDAFDNRYNDPKTWDKVLKAVSKEIGKEFKGLPDQKLSNDRELVTAAVRGASKTTVEDEAPDFSKMSDAEFQNWTNQF